MKLEDWLQQRNKTPTDFAREIEVDPSSITRLLPGHDKKQVRRPGRMLIVKIMRATNGAVTANDFVDPTLDGSAAA